MDNRFVKITAVEAEELFPKRGKYSVCAAFLDLKLLLFACNRVATRKIQNEVVTLKKWEESLALSFLDNRWKWKDTGRVSRQLKKWENKGFITIRKCKLSNFNILGLTVDKTTLETVDNTTLKTVDSTTLKGADNQRLTSNGKKLETVHSTVHKNMVTTIDRQLIKEEKKLKNINNITTTTPQILKLEFDLPYQRQAKLLEVFLLSEIGQETLKNRCFELKKNFPPSTNVLVKEVAKWAENKYRSQSELLASYQNGLKCWADFSKFWLPYVPKNWVKVENGQKNKARKGKTNEKRVFSEGDYGEGMRRNEVLYRQLEDNLNGKTKMA